MAGTRTSISQPTTICWPQPPVTLDRAQPLANSFALQQHMANLSLYNGRFLCSNCDLEEKESTVRAKNFTFPNCQAEAASKPEKLTSAYRLAGVEVTSIVASSSSGSKGDHDKKGQYPNEEKQESEEVSKMSSSVGPGVGSTQNSCPGSWYYFTRQRPAALRLIQINI